MPRTDPFLPIAPAQVKALVLPVGPVHQDRFASFLDRLRSEDAVHLRDISADSRPNRNMFSPLAFPDGVIFYDLIAHVPQPSHLTLVPFDHYREPLVILAVADGSALKTVAFGNKRQSAGRSIEERNIRTLYQELEELRDTYPHVLVHRVLIFDYEPAEKDPVPIPEGIATIPTATHSKRTTMRTIMCDVSSQLLAEMNALARSFDAMSYIESPGQPAGTSGLRPQIADEPPRRNSQFALPSLGGGGSMRSTSAGGSADRTQARMSMPVPFRSTTPASTGSTGSTPGRPGTPARGRGLSGPATTFDELVTGNDGATSISDRTVSPARTISPGGTPGSTPGADHRVSVQGFGPGGLNERWRNKGKCRVTIVVASLYLQAGRWTDALKELIEGATMARSMNDHLWHGKALELIVICLFLLAWADIEFQVPNICMPPPEKGSAAQAAAQAIDSAAERAHPTQPRWLRNLQLLLPELLDRILGLYTRISAEHLPSLPLSEATIRFANILTALHVADGLLGRAFLEMVVDGAPAAPLTTSPRLSVVPSRQQILTLVLRVFPAPLAPTELIATVDRIVILSGIASVLSRLGYRRKRALVVRELLSVLTEGLIEARTRGAADMGIHPAAGLLSQTGVEASGAGSNKVLDLAAGDVEAGLDTFLELLLQTYGVVEAYPGGIKGKKGGANDSDEAIVARIRQQTVARLFGLPLLKLNILRACINLAEALPDFGGVLKFSSDLLRTAGSGIAPGSRQEDATAMISREEQVRLAVNISKTSHLAQRLGGLPPDSAAEYWDEFLVRGIRLELPPTPCVPVSHSKSELPGTAVAARASQDVDPFIHNPFLKPAHKGTGVEQTLVAMEPATFRLTLQNPYDIELPIESIRLETAGVGFDAFAEAVVIGPYRTQIVKVAGIPKAAGTLLVTGAIVRVHGCRERRFPIFTQSWIPEREEKIKSIGVAPGTADAATAAASLMAVPGRLQRTLTGSGAAPLVPEHVSYHVIPAQPLVVVQSTTLPQSSAMILEGERQVFSVTLKNLSATTPVDFLLFSFQDSTQGSVLTALASRDATLSELYEYELILAKKQALRFRRRICEKGAEGEDLQRQQQRQRQRQRYMGPGETATFEFELLGKPGLTSGTIQIDYAHLGIPLEEVAESFHTRQVSQQLTVTVNASVEVVRMDVVPLQGRIPDRLWGRYGKAVDEKSEGEEDEEYCLLMMDLRNAWPSRMRVDLEAGDGVVVTEEILPGNTSRVLVPLRRIYVEDAHASIPALNPARQRQFVVSTDKISPDMERASREAFWYRERILDVLRGSWTAAAGSSSERHGTVELRSMRLTSRMIEAVKVDEVGIDVVMEDGQKKPTRSVQVDDFVQLRVRVTNRTAQPVYPMIRIMPALCHRPLNVALDFTRKFAWNGTLQQALPMLGPRSTTDVRIGATALCRGEFEVTASVEETRLWVAKEEKEKKEGEDEKEKKEDEKEKKEDEKEKKREDEKEKKEGEKEEKEDDDDDDLKQIRPRSNTETMMLDSMLGAKERRIWHSRVPCCFVVTD